MNEKVVEILVYLMQEIRGAQGGFADLEILAEDLQNQGYTQQEINSALSWLFDRMQDGFEELFQDDQGALPTSFRMLHDFEKMVLTPDAHGYLIQLRSLDLVDDLEVEQIIEKAMLLGANQVTADDIKTIAGTFILSGDSMHHASQMLSQNDRYIH